jgi:UTP-glucose-1-phosphate uridylyltransferase
MMAGCDQIIIITGRGKRVEDHFDVGYELEKCSKSARSWTC